MCVSYVCLFPAGVHHLFYVGVIEPSVVWEVQRSDTRLPPAEISDCRPGGCQLLGDMGHWLFCLYLLAFPRCDVVLGWRKFSSKWLNKKFVQFRSHASSRWWTVRSVQFGERRSGDPVQFVQFSSVRSVHELFRPWSPALSLIRTPLPHNSRRKIWGQHLQAISRPSAGFSRCRPHHVISGVISGVSSPCRVSSSTASIFSTSIYRSERRVTTQNFVRIWYSLSIPFQREESIRFQGLHVLIAHHLMIYW